MSTVEKKIEKLGRIVLPIEFREKLGIKNNSILYRKIKFLFLSRNMFAPCVKIEFLLKIALCYAKIA